MTSIKLTDYQCQALKVPVGSTLSIDSPPKPKTSRERFEEWAARHGDPGYLTLEWAAWLEAERQTKELPREH